ncbi:MAG: hypothetical protein NVSMB64_00850 [Candidatus Velthaea sp.]
MLCSTALIVFGVTAAAEAPAVPSSLPLGSPLTFISDETVDARVRPGSEFRAHLKDALSFGTTLVAPANTPVRLIVTQKDIRPDGSTRYTIALIRFTIPAAGDLPVRPLTNIVDAIATGREIAATTLGAVSEVNGKLRIAIPLPFQLSNDTPQGGYTPVPLRTAAPIVPHRPPTPPPAAPTPAPQASPT